MSENNKMQWTQKESRILYKMGWGVSIICMISIIGLMIFQIGEFPMVFQFFTVIALFCSFTILFGMFFE